MPGAAAASLLLAAGLFCAVRMDAASVVFRNAFAGSAQTRREASVAPRASLSAIATDRDGNLYVVGSTALGDLPVWNASQAMIRSGSLVRSDDGGRTWEPLPIPTAAVFPPAIHPRTPSTLLVSGVYGIYRSTDGGITWQVTLDLHDAARRRTIGYVDQIHYDPNDANRAYAGATGGVLRTIDRGETWTLLTAGISSEDCCSGASVAVDPQRTNRLVAVINGRAYLSDDRGDRWRSLRLPETSGAMHILPDPFRADTWYLAGYRAAWVTANAGSSWTRLPIETQMLFDLTPDRGAEGVLIANTAEGCLESDDRGQSWKPQSLGASLPEKLVYLRFDPVNRGRWYAGSGPGDGGRTLAYVSDNRGATWRSLEQPRDMEFVSDPANPNRIYAAGAAAADAWLAKYNSSGELQFGTYLGGQGEDHATAVAVDGSGNIHVGGTTSSTDLPAQGRRFGNERRPTIFVTRLNAAGQPQRTITFGGDEYDALGGIAAGADGSVHLALVTRSVNLPASAGAIPAVADAALQGYYAKLLDEQLLFSTYLGGSHFGRIRIAVDGSGGAVVGGELAHARYLQSPSSLWPPRETGEANLLRFSSSGELLAAARVPGMVKAVAAGEAGNIYVGGDASIRDAVAPGDAAYQRRIETSCPHDSGVTAPSSVRAEFMTDAWFAHLDANLTAVAGQTLFGGACVESVEDMALSADGSVTLAGQGYSDPLPATDPVAPAPSPGEQRVFLARFDGSGSRLLGSTYVQAAQGVAIAAIGDSLGLAANTLPWYSDSAPSLWKIAFDSRPALTITGIRNTFAAANTAVVPGGIATISVTGLPEDISVDLGLGPAGGAPTQIGGVTVTFDGLPAPLLGVRPGEITAVVPAALGTPGTAQVTVRTAGGAQGTGYVETAEALPALYRDIRNADGSVNSRDNSAWPGSRVTIYLTGIPAPASGFRDGELAPNGAAASGFISGLLVKETGDRIEIRDARPVPGFIFGLYYATIPAPQGEGQMTLVLPGRVPSSALIYVRGGG